MQGDCRAGGWGVGYNRADAFQNHMLRLTFLILVVVGALAVIVGLFAGMGMYQAAKLQAEPPATSATDSGTSRPTTRPTTVPAVSARGPTLASPEVVVIPPPKPEPAAEIAPDKPIVLTAAAATIIGDNLRLDPAAPPTIMDWSHRADGLEWTVQVPAAGLYDVEITYACDRTDGGGVFTMRAGRGGLSASVRPTLGWEDYQSAYVGKLYLSQGPTSLYIRPVYMLPGGRLMNLRSVSLKFVKAIDEPDVRSPFSRRRGFE